MEAKDVALLGFVSAAQKYVDKHINDGTKLGDLENMDIKTLKDQLSIQLKFLAMPENEKETLLSSGEKAFDEYVVENLTPKQNVIDELGQIFDVSFDDYDVKPIEEKNNINDLLEAYDTDENIEVTSTINKEETNDFGLKEDDDILLAIANAAAKSDEELAREFKNSEHKEIRNLDAAFADVVNHEKPLVEEIEKPSIPETKQAEIAEAIKNVEKAQASLSEVLKGIGKTETTTGYFKDYEPDDLPNIKKVDTPRQVAKPVGTLSSELKEIGEGLNESVSIKKETNTPPLNIIVNPGLDVVLDKGNDPHYYNVSKEEERATANEIIVEKEAKEHTISSALAGLGKLQEKQVTKEEVEEDIISKMDFQPKQEEKLETKKEEKIEEKPQPVKETVVSKPIVRNNIEEKIYSNIMLAYPYLNKGFVVSAYSHRDEIASEYRTSETYIIIHRLSFEDLEELHEFVEIMMAHNYLVNVDEKKMIVDAIREFVNRDGVILTNIFSIANQAKILNGEYEGYRVINKEGK